MRNSETSGDGRSPYVHSLELMHQYSITHVRRIAVGSHLWCILTLTGLHQELLIAKEAFTENEEFCTNMGLMTAGLVYRGLDDDGLETLSVLYIIL